MRRLPGAGGPAGAPSCVTLRTPPPTVRVPARAELPVFVVTAYVTVPVPEPLVPEAMVIQLLLSVTVHEQLLSVFTVTVAVPAEAGND